jgi:hypothetical protein
MAGEWILTVDASAWEGKLSHVAVGLAATEKIHERIVIALQRHVFKNMPKTPGLSPFTMLSRRGSVPLQDTRTMMQSVTGSNPAQIATAPFTLNAAGLEAGTIGSKFPGAAVHNFGATIRPVRAKALALPATREAKKAGGPRSFPRELFFVKPKGGSGKSGHVGWLAESKGRGKNARLERHFMLRTSVEIPQRQWFPTKDEARPVAVKVISFTLRELAAGKDPARGPSDG